MILSDGSLSTLISYMLIFTTQSKHSLFKLVKREEHLNKGIGLRERIGPISQPVDDNQSETQTYNTEETKAIDLLFTL